MQSKRRLAPVVSKDGISGTRGTAAPRDQEVPLLELDTTFGRLLGLADGQKVGVLLHIDPPISHTVNIEPLTPADWEIIELHATFLELNLLSQIRALPNPDFTGAPSAQAQTAHPLTLHLSPTSTANIIVTSLTPPIPATSPFAKIAPDAEVIVAPKVRPKLGRNAGSISGTSRKSGRSTSSTVRPRSSRGEAKGAVYLRGISRKFCSGWFDDEEEDLTTDTGLKIWVDKDIMVAKELRGSTWVAVSVVKPAGTQAPVDPQKLLAQKELESGEAGKVTTKIAAKIQLWSEPPNGQHAAISKLLASVLGEEDLAGGILRLEAIPTPLSKSAVSTIKVYPFASETTKRKDGLKFGGESQASKDALAERIGLIYGDSSAGEGLLSGPITDGMRIPKSDNSMPASSFQGGIIRFEPPLKASTEGEKPFGWLLGFEVKPKIEVQPEIPAPISSENSLGQPVSSVKPEMVGVDKTIDQIMNNLTRASSVLLTGGLGSGKSSLAHLICHTLREEHLFNVSYLSCQSLITEQTRVSTIKETLNRIFMSAAWHSRLSGKAVVVLDDLDKFCPAETELQTGDNERSRQISELICSITKEYCTVKSGVLLLATAQAKEALNNVIVGGHVVREIINLKAPNKDGRRRVLEKLTSQDRGVKSLETRSNGHMRSVSNSTSDSWLDPSNPASRLNSSAGSSDGFVLDKNLDFLDLAGKTDGYMPGDLVLLVSRARNEALIRSVQDTSDTSSSANITLGKDDFDRALKGFTPASLRNVTLTSSSTTFSSIGGLHETRKILLETLQYPTKYAPIFAQCPLRLRSGLLLYGYPGCGKTLLASAVAGECGLNFISVKGPEILNKYIGASEKSVRDLFERAEAARPCILFFDEFDSIAPKRGHDSTGVTDRVANQLLTQMDGAEGLSGVYVLAATSRPDLIDPALLRPGRLDKSLLCDMPSHDDRLDILRAVGQKLKFNQEVLSNLHVVAARTEGYSGADLQAVAYNAHLEAIHDVLGDRSSQTASSTATRTTSSKRVNGTTPATLSSSKDFLQFLYSPDEPTSRSSLTPTTQINTTLSDLRLARKKVKAAMFPQNTVSTAQGQANGMTSDENEPVISWKHIEASLVSTRSSISSKERIRLEGIYREFVVGRNGEMPSGEAGREIGGRSSLM